MPKINELSLNPTISNKNSVATSTLNIPINTPLIDSLGIYIPFDYLSEVHYEITDSWYKYYNNPNEYSEEQSPSPVKIEYNGISLRFQKIENRPNKNRISNTYLKVTVSAKLLQQNYFEGINKTNIKQIYDYLLEHKMFKISYENFLKSEVGDIDICKNYYLSKDNFNLCINTIKALSQKNFKYLNHFNKKTNTGLDLNTRIKASPSRPYIKLYHKELELLHKSDLFYNTYLKYQNPIITNLVRVEATIKNSKHKDRLSKYKIMSKCDTLEQLLNIDKNTLNNFIQFSINSYTTAMSKLKTYTHSMITNSLKHLIIKHIKDNKELDYILFAETNDTYKSPDQSLEAYLKQVQRHKKLLTELYHEIKEKKQYSNEIENNEICQQFLLNIGVKQHDLNRRKS